MSIDPSQTITESVTWFGTGTAEVKDSTVFIGEPNKHNYITAISLTGIISDPSITVLVGDTGTGTYLWQIQIGDSIAFPTPLYQPGANAKLQYFVSDGSATVVLSVQGYRA